jgi:transposase
MKYTLGIDLHKKTSAWVVIDDKRNEMWKSTVACHPEDISIAIGKIPVSPKEVQVAIEPVTGWRWVTKQLGEAGMEVHIAHPRKIRLIAESNQKNDKNDALMLAELLRSGYFPESRRVSDEVFEMRTMLRDRAYVVSLRTGVKNRIHGIATTHGLHLIPGGNPLHKKRKVIYHERKQRSTQRISFVD